MNGPSILDKPITFKPYYYKGSEVIQLSKVPKVKLNIDFMSIFSGRRSVKELGACSLDALSNILFYAVKPYCIGKDDYGVTVYRSAAPSAGGRHPIDLLVGIKERGRRHLYLYQPIEHSLKRLNIKEKLQNSFFKDVEDTLPFGESVLLWFSIQYMRTASKYTDYMSLVWRDVGAQLCCLQQAAKYVGLDSCPIGYLAEETFQKMFQSEILLSGGGMIIGIKKKDDGSEKLFL